MRDQLVLASLFDRLTTQEKNEIDAIFKKVLLEGIQKFTPGSREKKSFPDGIMYLLADPELCCIYAVSVKSKSYPERVAYACLGEMIKLVAGSEDSNSLNTVSREGALTRSLRKPMKDLMDKYDTPGNVDKCSEVNSKVDAVKGIMQDNINKVIATHANIQELEAKTDNLNMNAEEFHRTAGDVNRMMWWQKVKVTIMLCIVALAILAYVVVTIVKYTT